MVMVTGIRSRHRFARGTSGDFGKLYRSGEIMLGIWRSRGDRKNDTPAVDVESRRLCAKSNSEFNFEGRLDEFGVFDRALNLKEVRSIFPVK